MLIIQLFFCSYFVFQTRCIKTVGVDSGQLQKLCYIYKYLNDSGSFLIC